MKPNKCYITSACRYSRCGRLPSPTRTISSAAARCYIRKPLRDRCQKKPWIAASNSSKTNRSNDWKYVVKALFQIISNYLAHTWHTPTVVHPFLRPSPPHPPSASDPPENDEHAHAYALWCAYLWRAYRSRRFMFCSCITRRPEGAVDTQDWCKTWVLFAFLSLLFGLMFWAFGGHGGVVFWGYFGGILGGIVGGV